MGPLPSPRCTFTIPSVHDETRLDCRIYHPPQIPKQRAINDAAGPTSWRKRGAIIAHPYAPLGGCYDDPVVSVVASELLQAGYVVGTFNFRGAAGSEGRTSWTGKPELADYISFYGFMIYYLCGLNLDYEQQDVLVAEPVDRADGCTRTENDEAVGNPRLVLAGYSYGSMIASHLPSLEVVLGLFAATTAATAEKKSPVSEIVGKARELAALWSAGYGSRNEAAELLSSSQTSESSTRSTSARRISMGSGSDLGSKGQAGRVERRSRKGTLEGIGKSLERSGKKLRARFEHSSDGTGDILSQSQTTEVQGNPKATISYLLISPILPPISTFATMSFFTSRTNLDTSIQGHPVKAGIPDTQLTTHPTLALYGSADMFTSGKKLQTWAGQLSEKLSSQFRFKEVEGVGHFWNERGAEAEMRGAVREWALG